MQGDTREADAVNDLLLERYGDAADPDLREIVASARQNRADRGAVVPIVRPDRLDATRETGWYGRVKRMITGSPGAPRGKGP